MRKGEFVKKHGEEAHKILVGSKQGIRNAIDLVTSDIEIILVLLGFHDKGLLEAKKTIAAFLPADNVEEACMRAETIGYPVELQAAFPIKEMVSSVNSKEELIDAFPKLQAISLTNQVGILKPKKTPA